VGTEARRRTVCSSPSEVSLVIRVSSTMITAFAPSGRGAPVVMRAIWPGWRGGGDVAEACEI